MVNTQNRNKKSDNGNYVSQVKSNDALTVKSGFNSAQPNLNDIAFANNGLGYIVGNSKRFRIITLAGTVINGPVIPSLGPVFNLNALHIFRNNTLIAVGTGSTIKYFNGASWTDKQNNAPAGQIFNDVFFHDDRNGYVVGNNGVFLKSKLLTNINAASVIDWKQKSIVDAFGVTNPALVNINTVGFPTRYTGFIAGSTVSPLGGPTGGLYARLIKDESEFYSVKHFYDRLGRLIVSQNTKQFNRNPKAVTYTRFDAGIGRKKEEGEKSENAPGHPQFASIFGSYVNGHYNPDVIDDAKYNAWIDDTTGERREVLRLYYDNQQILSPNILMQENLRKRLAAITYDEIFDGVDSTYNFGTYFSYDIHGNAKTLLQDNQSLGLQLPDQRYKKIDYDYDLISGNIKGVSYQKSQADQFFHRYEYDADNRITGVETSKDGVLWDKDAKYFYYADGKLARIEYADNQVQGQDFAYTIQGWVKGVNSNIINAHNDIGQDGKAGTINQNFARDAFGYSLVYYNSDYKAIDPAKNLISNNFIADVTAAAYLQADAPNLFNGNISHMVTSLTDIASGSPTYGQPIPQLSAYRYDQLNRVVQMKAYRDINLANNYWGNGSTYDGIYETHLTYDANGNILTMQRNGTAGVNVNMDNLTYTYQNTANGYASNTNKLRHVNDNTSYTSNYNTDIDDQGAFSIGNENYAFDEIGNQIQDKSEGIAFQEWNVYGKVKSIIRYNGSTKPDLEFKYDAFQRRITKIVKPRDVNGQRPVNEWTTTHYVRDAQGNVMAVYEQSYDTAALTANFILKERYMYGYDRLGADKMEVEMISAPPAGNIFSRTLGKKNFDLTNFRGDLLTAVTDKKIPVEDTQNPGTIAYYKPDIITTSETYLFGMPQPGRNVGITDNRHGYQGQEMVNEINGKPGTHYTADNWEYNSLTGRRENNDPKPDASKSTYSVFKNNPLGFSDPLGDTIVVDPKGLILRNDQTDNLVFLSEKIGKKTSLTPLGEIGKTVNVNKIFTNLLAENKKEAENLYNPLKFEELVETGGEWDLKNNEKYIYGLAAKIEKEKGLGFEKTTFLFDSKTLKTQDVGNFNFGVVSKAYFGKFRIISDEFILKGAGEYQIKSGTSRPEWQKYRIIESWRKDPFGGWEKVYRKEMRPPYGDDPRDQTWIIQGFQYYNKQFKDR